MKRRLFNLAAALSLVLCLVVCVLWVRGQRTADWVWWTRADEHDWRRDTLASGSDGFFLRHEWYGFDGPEHPWAHSGNPADAAGLSHLVVASQPNPFSGSFSNRIGFGTGRETRVKDAPLEGTYYVCSRAQVPYWFVLAVLLAPCGLWLVRTRALGTRSRRAWLNQCLQCGYDLRAHGGGDRCPECGTANPAK
jgi:hypothetical protein